MVYVVLGSLLLPSLRIFGELHSCQYFSGDNYETSLTTKLALLDMEVSS